MRPQKEYLTNFLKKTYMHYRLVVGIIFLIEIFFIIRFVFFRNFGKLENKIYFCAYVFLAVASLVTVILLSIGKGRFCLHGTRLNAIAAGYSTSILFWACLISSVDVYRGKLPIVFITVLFAVSALNLIEPIYFTIQTVVQTGVILAMYFYVNHFDNGLLINIIILYVTAVLITFRSFSTGQENYRYSEHLKKLSYMDPMTNVNNRRALDRKTECLLDRGTPFYFIVGDIDSFKNINDTYGHIVGDECICFMADQLHKAFPNHVFRYGGDEFVVISDATQEEIGEILKPYTAGVQKGDICLHMSFGVMRYTPGMSMTDLFHTADAFLYQSKKAGKATVSFLDEKNIAHATQNDLTSLQDFPTEQAH